jgi:capsular polysaccharide biosynthesis protein
MPQSLETSATGDLASELAQLRCDVADSRQRVMILEGELAKHRANSSVNELAQLRRDLTVSRQRLTSLRVMIAGYRTDSAAAPAVPPRSHPQGNSAHSIDLSRVQCASVFDRQVVSDRGTSRSESQFGTSRIPIIQVPDVTYLPSLRLQLTSDNVSPLEALHHESVLDFLLGQDRGVLEFNSISEIDEDVCILSNPFSLTFGHWLDEELIKVFVLESAGFAGRYLIYSGDQPEQQLPPFVLESFSLMGIDESRLITELRDVTRFRSAAFIPPLHRNTILAFGDAYLAFRERLLSLAGAGGLSVRRRLWLARGVGAVSGRTSLVNEQVIADLLDEYGFDFVDMGALGFKDQILMAASADVIAGPHGSGIKHTFFQPKGSTLIECFSPNFINTSVLNLCRLLGHRYHMLIHEAAYDDYRWGLDLKVNPVHLALVLERLD